MSIPVSSQVEPTEPVVWYAMSATFGRALKARDFLEARSVPCFIPMKYEVVSDAKQGKKRRCVPAINNLLFVRTTRSCIQTLKSEVTYLQYLTRPEGLRRIPIVVPDHQMEQFITVCNTYNDKLVYLNPEEVNLDKGTPVKIIGGMFDGIEGTFVKIEGVRNRRVVLLVPGIAAVVIADITNGCLQVLDK
jgi:transcription antitermination factor NusG